MIRVYIYGCNCGTNATYVRLAKKHAKAENKEIKIINSKYEGKEDHARYLRIAGFNSDGYQPILVEDDKIALLKLWTP